jgi:hypothetical protein
MKPNLHKYQCSVQVIGAYVLQNINITEDCTFYGVMSPTDLILKVLASYVCPNILVFMVFLVPSNEISS